MPFFNNYITLDDPLGVLGTQATGINKYGQIVGYYIDGNGQKNGFIYSQGTYTTITGTQTVRDANGGTHTYTFAIVPQGINDTDQIVGYFGSGASFLYNYNTGFFFPTGNVTGTGDAQGINDQNVVVGSYNFQNSSNGPANHGVIYPNYQSNPWPLNSGNTTLDYPNATSTFANGINNKGVVVGYYVKPVTGANQLLYMNGSYVGASGFAGFSTYGEGINDFNQYAGYYTDSNGIAQGYVSIPGISYRTYDVLGASSTYLYGINDAGEVVGAYVDSSGNTHGLLATVPTPPAPAATTTYTFKTLDDPSAVFGTYAYGINKNGQIVGYYVDGNGQKNGFVYSQGTYTAIIGTQTVTDANGETHTYTFPVVPQGINDTDQIVGYFGGGAGFLYNYNTGFFFPTGNVTGTGDAQGINNQNVVVGSYNFQNSSNGPANHGVIYPNYQSNPCRSTLLTPRSIIRTPPLRLQTVSTTKAWSSAIILTPTYTATNLPMPTAPMRLGMLRPRMAPRSARALTTLARLSGITLIADTTMPTAETPPTATSRRPKAMAS
jgi:probable HAF family extracellular repeat protein